MWGKIKVHGVTLDRYLSQGRLALAKEKIELQNNTSLPFYPRWLIPPAQLRESHFQLLTLVVTLRDSQLVGELLQTGLFFGGRRYKVERF